MSEINPFEILPYQEDLKSRVTEQFKESIVFNKYLELLSNPMVELQLVLRDLMQKRSLDTATGKQLDILGEIVGQPRTLINADLISFFGFQNQWQADSYGSLNDPSVGSVWWDGKVSYTGNIVLNDDLYRILIKAKIAKNVTRATPEDVMNFSNFIFNTNGSTIIDEGEAKYRLMIGKILTRQEVGLLRYVNKTGNYDSFLLPKPVGVGVEYGSFDYSAFFAFQGIPNAKGYGSLGFTYYFDGTHLYDGEVVPSTYAQRDEEGNLIGGKWARLHEDI